MYIVLLSSSLAPRNMDSNNFTQPPRPNWIWRGLLNLDPLGAVVCWYHCTCVRCLPICLDPRWPQTAMAPKLSSLRLGEPEQPEEQLASRSFCQSHRASGRPPPAFFSLVSIEIVIYPVL